MLTLLPFPRLVLTEFATPATYYTAIPLINDRTLNRRFDAAKLREIKKRLENPACSIEDFDEVANEVMDDAVDLSSDREFLSTVLLHLRRSLHIFLLQTSETPSSRRFTRNALLLSSSCSSNELLLTSLPSDATRTELGLLRRFVPFLSPASTRDADSTFVPFRSSTARRLRKRSPSSLRVFDHILLLCYSTRLETTSVRIAVLVP